MGKVYIVNMGIHSMGQDIKVPALVSLTFHWNIMENQTLLSVHRAIKDKCVCYCSHSVFLSVLCAPLGDVKACCRSTINPKLAFSFFSFYHKGMLVSGWRLTMAQGWMQSYMRGPTEDWMDSGVWWMTRLLLNQKALAPSETPTNTSGVAAWGKYNVLIIPLVTLTLCAIWTQFVMISPLQSV